MSLDESPSTILREHLALCAELHALLLEENRIMRVDGTPPPEDLLAKKKEFLPRLDASLARLRTINESARRLGQAERDAVKEARSRLMQILMLDRENERLLLKASLPANLKAAYTPAVPGQVARAYQRYASQSGGGARPAPGAAPAADTRPPASGEAAGGLNERL
ncbi:MAG: hypothetical protein D6781_12015 [Verrucomicrobia bacterium]|nr:MAG: hypothetical protein D6781_12015 [Verrucomicrobiota bacterium]